MGGGEAGGTPPPLFWSEPAVIPNNGSALPPKPYVSMIIDYQQQLLLTVNFLTDSYYAYGFSHMGSGMHATGEA